MLQSKDLLEVSVEHNTASTIRPSKKPEQINTDDGLVELMEVLEEINENKASAKLNEISMIDNMGRRIYY